MQRPGRLGDDKTRFETDVRADPRIADIVKLAGGFGAGLEPLAAGATYTECLDYCMAFERVETQAHAALLEMVPSFDDVEITRESIVAADGHEITLYLHQPKSISRPLPGVIHLHGGGMAITTADDPGPTFWRNLLAAQGLRVIGVEYRNAAGKLGNHPFPAGLNDCADATRWVNQRRSTLGIESITVSGESGGGNLALATALKANAEHWIDAIDGVYAMCPYIYGGYANPSESLP